MAKLKRLAELSDNVATVECPIDTTELNSRQHDYPLLPPIDFAKKYKDGLFQPVVLNYMGNSFVLQVNFCTNPYCKWFGMTQFRFEKVKHKPSRYKLFGSGKHKTQSIICNPDPVQPNGGRTTWGCTTTPYSNWSLAEEIIRLSTHDRVRDLEVKYQFHQDGCLNTFLTPFDNPKEFYKRGKSSSNSQKWQCKECRKITNVLPNRVQSFSYHQQRNDVLHEFAKLVINHIPVKRTCEILGIGSQTYYGKLEWLYKRCLEFLERHETKAFANQSFDTIWLNTDKLVYFLNNIRKKGHGGIRYDNLEDKQFATLVVVSAESFSRYVFRSDVAFDWDVRLENINQDTVSYKEDHLNEFARKNARFGKFSFTPQPPTENDTETEHAYLQEVQKFNQRNKYIEGLHVNSSYTTMAHLWLIKQMMKTKEWRFVTDEDSSIMTSLFRIFAHEVKVGDAHHFLCKVDRTKSRSDAFRERQEGYRELKSWGEMKDYMPASPSKLSVLKLTELLNRNQFYEMVPVGGKSFPKWAKKPIQHPLPTIDQGFREIDCTTDITGYDPEELARLVNNVNDRATNEFMQVIRRRISILERPLVTARGDGKSYIYSNCNPKYAQYALTILRTYYNFCLPYKTKDKIATPAQRLGITDRQFTIKDIVYFK